MGAAHRMVRGYSLPKWTISRFIGICLVCVLVSVEASVVDRRDTELLQGVAVG